jgi:hypothetical protein
MSLSPKQLEQLVLRVWPKVKITRVFHPRLRESRVIETPRGINIRYEKGPYGYQTSDGKRYPPEVERPSGN